jgi:hypothetical protein
MTKMKFFPTMDPPVDPSYLEMRELHRKHRSRSVCCTISGYVHHFKLLARPRAHAPTLSHVRPDCITRYSVFFLLPEGERAIPLSATFLPIVPRRKSSRFHLSARISPIRMPVRTASTQRNSKALAALRLMFESGPAAMTNVACRVRFRRFESDERDRSLDTQTRPRYEELSQS